MEREIGPQNGALFTGRGTSSLLLQHRSKVRDRAHNPERQPKVKLLIILVKIKRWLRIKSAANVHDPE